MGYNALSLFCTRLAPIGWLQDHLLPCPFKYLTGIDCPGCGFQRSVLALIQGQLRESFVLYPPAIPLLLFFVYCIAGNYFKTLNKQRMQTPLFIMVSSIVLINYGFKMWGLYHHHILSAAAI
jgi:hypothetical protein